MSFLKDLDLNRPGVPRLWAAMDAVSRTDAARALYDAGDPAQRAEADAAIAERMRFRMASVRKLPLTKRVEYLSRAVIPDDSLATDLLLALHLGCRRKMLSVFLDSLEIPNDEGVIDEDHELLPPATEDLRRSVTVLLDAYPETDVELYLACLWSMDPGNWGGLSEILRERAGT